MSNETPLKMQFIDAADLPPLLPVFRKKETTLRAMLKQLEIGQGVFMPFEKWKNKRGPSYVISALKKTTGMRFEYGKAVDGTGWLFRRIA